jgi:predicted metalloendopeptidase
LHQVTEKVALALLGGFIAATGGIIVALWSDKLTRKREHQSGIINRRREFIVFMWAWRMKHGE